jgi:hypothetical protein
MTEKKTVYVLGEKHPFTISEINGKPKLRRIRK